MCFEMGIEYPPILRGEERKVNNGLNNEPKKLVRGMWQYTGISGLFLTIVFRSARMSVVLRGSGQRLNVEQ
jgi:hypothetical protein